MPDRHSGLAEAFPPLCPKGDMQHVAVLWNGQMLSSGSEGLPRGVDMDATGEGPLEKVLRLRITGGTRLACPLHLVHVTTAAHAVAGLQIMHSRVEVHLDRESRGMLIETHVSLGDGPALSAPVCEVHIGPRAHLDHIRVMDENRRTFHQGRTEVDLDHHSSYSSWEVALGGTSSHRELNVRHRGESSRAELNGLQLGRDRQIHEAHTLVRHSAPGCQTRELYKSVLDDHSQGIFDGLIQVDREAQQTDARQSNRNLLLSDDALARSSPRLEIYADDVRCAHGATTGTLDEQQLFYLHTRGFDHETARATLVYAFASDVLDSIPCEPLRRRITDEVFSLLTLGGRIREAA